ncbi:MAG: AMP-binding protein [Myxococcales bacterium]|nr:AMP-binding protein [Myxococcales bacterium]
MMTLSELLAILKERGVTLRVESGDLKVQAPKGALDAALVSTLKHHKPALIDALLGVQAAGDVAREAPVERKHQSRYPLALPQERLFLAQQLDPGGTVYNLPGAWRLDGPFDAEAMRAALEAFIDRHDLLRSRFDVAQGSPALVTEAGLRASILPDVDLSGDADPEAALQAALGAEANHAFDLTIAPPARFTVYRLGPEVHVLYVVTHAIIWDGWSFDLFLNDIATLYAAELATRTGSPAPAPLPELPIAYGDYAIWQRERVSTLRVSAQRDTWRQILAPPLPFLDLPTDRPRPALVGHRGERVYLRFPESTVAPIAALARAESTTVYTVLLAAWEAVLHRYSGATDVIVTTPVRGRERPELEPGIGIYTNTLFVRADLAGDPTFRELLARTRRASVLAMDNQDAPVDDVIGELSKHQDLSRSALFQAQFSYQNTNNRITMVGPCTCRFVPQDIFHVYADLNFWVKDAQGRLLGAVDYRSELYDQKTVERLIAHLEQLLIEVGQNPDRAISTLPLEEGGHPGPASTVGELGKRVDDATSRTAELAFETPDVIAIADEAGELTFADLETQVRARANDLLDRGVRPGHRVPVDLLRNASAIVESLAVLRLGAAIVPRRPSDPPALTEALCAAAAQLEGHPTGIAVVLFPRAIDARRGVSAGDATLVRTEALRWATSALGVHVGLEKAPRRVLSTSRSGLPLLVEALTALGRGATLDLCPDATLDDAWDLRDRLETHPPGVVLGDPQVLRAIVDEGALPEGARVALFGAPDAALVSVLPADATWIHGPAEAAYVLFAEPVHAWAQAGGPMGNTPLPWSNTPLVGARVSIMGALGVTPRGLPGTIAFTVPGSRLITTRTPARVVSGGAVAPRDGTWRRRNGKDVDEKQVSAALAEQPGVAAAYVGFAMAAVGDARLTAWVRGERSSPPVTTLREALARRLLPEAVPGAIVPLPSTESGTAAGGASTANPVAIDVRTLPNPFEGADRSAAELKTPAERLIAEIWSQLLGRPTLPATANFFESGGSSLLALRAVLELERRSGWRADPRLLFYQSLRDLAARVPAT